MIFKISNDILIEDFTRTGLSGIEQYYTDLSDVSNRANNILYIRNMDSNVIPNYLNNTKYRFFEAFKFEGSTIITINSKYNKFTGLEIEDAKFTVSATGTSDIYIYILIGKPITQSSTVADKYLDPLKLSTRQCSAVSIKLFSLNEFNVTVDPIIGSDDFNYTIEATNEKADYITNGVNMYGENCIMDQDVVVTEHIDSVDEDGTKHVHYTFMPDTDVPKHDSFPIIFGDFAKRFPFYTYNVLTTSRYSPSACSIIDNEPDITPTQYISSCSPFKNQDTSEQYEFNEKDIRAQYIMSRCLSVEPTLKLNYKLLEYPFVTDTNYDTGETAPERFGLMCPRFIYIWKNGKFQLIWAGPKVAT